MNSELSLKTTASGLQSLWKIMCNVTDVWELGTLSQTQLENGRGNHCFLVTFFGGAFVLCFSHNNQQTTFGHPVTGRPVSEENPPPPPRLVFQIDTQYLINDTVWLKLRKVNLQVSDMRGGPGIKQCVLLTVFSWGYVYFYRIVWSFSCVVPGWLSWGHFGGLFPRSFSLCLMGYLQ